MEGETYGLRSAELDLDMAISSSSGVMAGSPVSAGPAVGTGELEYRPPPSPRIAPIEHATIGHAVIDEVVRKCDRVRGRAPTQEVEEHRASLSWRARAALAEALRARAVQTAARPAT
jgi:hypothetical protein